ncbi:MAG: Rab family GTPase [Gammaproteobacteria bacterium]
MERITRKVCLLGAAAVGKTSLSTRFLTNTFSEQYLSTVGLRVGSRELLLREGLTLKLIIWDIAGTRVLTRINTGYLKGTAGIAYVADGTRRETLTTALDLRAEVARSLAPVPSVLLLNKADLGGQWDIEADDLLALISDGVRLFKTSAKDGTGVEAAFVDLSRSSVRPCIAEG